MIRFVLLLVVVLGQPVLWTITNVLWGASYTQAFVTACASFFSIAGTIAFVMFYKD